MRITVMLTAALAGLVAAGASRAASVEVRDAVARVTVIPENRSDIKVEFAASNSRLPLKVRSSGGRTIVDGRLGGRIRGCRGVGEGVSVRVRGVGDVGWREMPQVVIRMPRDVDMDAGGAVWGSVGRSVSLKLGNAGCGDWTVANVDGPLRISQVGTGNTKAGAAGQARLRSAGSGDISVGDVRGPLTVDIAGSGDVTAASISGALDVRNLSSGDVAVASGRATTMSVMVGGSGSVDFRGVAATLKARVAGSGHVRVRQVTGAVSKTVMGSGAVTIGP